MRIIIIRRPKQSCGPIYLLTKPNFQSTVFGLRSAMKIWTDCKVKQFSIAFIEVYKKYAIR